jgi:hypothetical protein
MPDSPEATCSGAGVKMQTQSGWGMWQLCVSADEYVTVTQHGTARGMSSFWDPPLGGGWQPLEGRNWNLSFLSKIPKTCRAAWGRGNYLK